MIIESTLTEATIYVVASANVLSMIIVRHNYVLSQFYVCI